MGNRIEGNAAQLLCGVIAQPEGHEGMHEFVNRDCHDKAGEHGDDLLRRWQRVTAHQLPQQKEQHDDVDAGVWASAAYEMQVMAIGIAQH